MYPFVLLGDSEASPIHGLLSQCFNKKGFYPEKRLPIAKELGETSLMFLIDQTITSENMIQYMNVVKRVLKKAKK